MKKLFFIALFLPVISFAKVGIALSGGLNMPPVKNPNVVHFNKVYPVKASFKFFVSIKKLEIGIGGEYGGLRTKGKITKWPADFASISDQSPVLYTHFVYVSPFVYGNYRYLSLPKIDLYAGLTLGNSFPGKKNKNPHYLYSGGNMGAYYTYFNPLWKQNTTVVVLQDDFSPFGGLQTGVVARPAKKLSVYGELAMRYAVMNGVYGYPSFTGNTFLKVSSPRGDISYRVIYYPVTLGVRYTF